MPVTNEQKDAIKEAWEKKRQTHERIQQTAEHCKTGGLAQLPLDEMEQRFADQAAAVKADSAALDAVEQAMKAAGLL
jgi:hypothetical protein